MIEQLKIREALDMLDADGDMCKWTNAHTQAIKDAVDRLTQLEAMVGEQEPVKEPIELLWQVRSALALACAICDAVPSREPSHLGKLVNAQPDGAHGYRKIHDAESALAAYLTTPTAAPVAQQQGEVVVTWDEQRTRILAVTRQDEEGRVLSVIAEAPAQQPQAEAVSVECHEVIAGVTGNTVRPRELTEREHNVLMRAMVCSGKKVEAPQQAEAVPSDVVCNKDPQGCWNVRCQLGKVCKNAAIAQQKGANHEFRKAV